MITPELADRLARVALGHVTREYPVKLDHVLNGPDDLISQRVLHPIFFGSFDWHSCVHAYWMLARLLRLCPGMTEAERIRAHFTAMFTPDHVAVELAYLSRPLTRTFERPYGWAWLLMLAAEVPPLKPLAEAFARRFLDYLPKATYPVRSGVHSNTAFALALALEYPDEALARSVTAAARRWYLDDTDCQAWEPGGEDFLSPCLIEAECMRRVLPAEEFADWFARFLPRLKQSEPRTLFEPVTVSDRTDGRIAHLDGLNLSRAWCWRGLASAVPEHAELMRDAASRHLEASIGHVAGDYMGEHWLATFALLALTAGS